MKKRFIFLAIALALLIPALSFANDSSDLAVCDINNDGVRNLSDVSLFSSCVDTFDVNNDGVHDLTDTSLYTSNNQNNSWCQTNFRCSAATSTNAVNDANDPRLAVCDINNDGVRNLSDVSLFAGCVNTFDVNNDGVHDLTDISLHTSNNQNNSWCQTNFRCAPTITDFSSYLKVAEFRATNLLGSYPILSTARVWWRANIGSMGEYRYSKDMIAIRNLPWRTDGVINDPDVTGNMFASQVNLNGLDDNSTYYVDVRKRLGTQYGEAQSFAFTTGEGNYPGFAMSLDRASYTTRDTAMLKLRSYNALGAPYNVNLYGKFNPVGENSKTFLIRSNITVGSEEDIPVDLSGFARSSNKEHEYSLLICSSHDGCVMGSTNSIMINIETDGTDDNDDLPSIDKSLDKVKVCHLTGNTRTQTLEISKEALATHLAHGDKAGECARAYYDPEDVNVLLTRLNKNRNSDEENRFKKLVLADTREFAVNMSDVNLGKVAIFVAYGIDDSTEDLGTGERQAVLRDFLQTTGYSNVNWRDIVRLTNGEKPVTRNLAKEQAQVARALKTFETIYGHKPNFQNAEEDLVWNTLMYRIRFTRDLAQEKLGIAEFNRVFGRNPSEPYDWAVVRAFAYVILK